jgi:hypothetical protein
MMAAVCRVRRERGQALHAENTGSATDIENNLVLEQVRVLVDRVLVCVCSHFIFLARKGAVRMLFKTVGEG